MLVLNSSSECDVCFEPYGLKDSADTPHSIRCGHVFCRRCLDDMMPRSCPLCRNPFTLEQITRLHVDPPPEDTGSKLVNVEGDFLRRLIFALYDNPTSTKFSDAMEEAFTWLESQPPDSNELLRSAWVVFSTLHPNDKPGQEDYELYRQLHEKDRMYQEAKVEWDIKVAELEAEVTSIRSSNIKLRHYFEKKLTASEAEVSMLRSEITSLQNATPPVTRDVSPVITTPTTPVFKGKAPSSHTKHSSAPPINVFHFNDIKTTGDGLSQIKGKLTGIQMSKPGRPLGGTGKKRAPPRIATSDVTTEELPNVAACAVALYDFQAKDEADVSFTTGDNIEQIEQREGGWWSGVVAGGSKRGLFPANYVKLVEQTVVAAPTPHRDKPKNISPSQIQSPVGKGVCALVSFDFKAVDDGDMSLTEGEIIEQIDRVDGGWWRGVGAGGQKKGLFPANYVVIIQQPVLATLLSPGMKPEKTVSQMQPSVGKGLCARVLHDFRAMSDGEMNLTAGEIIEQITETDHEWWCGVGTGGSKSGLFPGTYVKVLDDLHCTCQG